jgi:hypothetical protein
MKTELISQKTLDSLLEYSLSIPSGAIPGKVWKRNLGLTEPPTWIICEYVDHSTDKNLLIVEYRQPIIKES